MKASFAEEQPSSGGGGAGSGSSSAHNGDGAQAQQAEQAQQAQQQLVFGRRKWKHWFRRWQIRWAFGGRAAQEASLGRAGWCMQAGPRCDKRASHLHACHEQTCCASTPHRAPVCSLTLHPLLRLPSGLSPRCRRLKGHLLPHNSGLLAREALSHPFLSPGVQVPHAPVPNKLAAAFPDYGA